LLFSEYYNIQGAEAEQWFDPLLIADTKLFVDPFLVYSSKLPEFDGAHDTLVGYFNSLFQLVAISGMVDSDVGYAKALALSHFPEVSEACLGHCEFGTRGRGSGQGLGRLVVTAIRKAITAGLSDVRHFEEVGILQPGFGPDRISDITLRLLRPYFVKYTQAVCERHSVPLQPFDVPHSVFDSNSSTWLQRTELLPLNPDNHQSVLLVPKSFLRRFPTIHFESFYAYCTDRESELLRQEFNLDISANIDRRKVLEFARKHADVVGRYISFTEAVGSLPYDLVIDSSGVRNWYPVAIEISKAAPPPPPLIPPEVHRRDEDLPQIVRILLNELKSTIELKGSWELLWNDNGKPRRERVTQKLLMTIAFRYCKIHDLDVTQEAETGRGPVDFKFSRGARKVLAELKHLSNSSWWDGFESQLPIYMACEEALHGFYVAVAHRDKELARHEKLITMVKQYLDLNPSPSEYLFIDARRPLSASKVRKRGQ
jgi:hypothetical protein